MIFFPGEMILHEVWARSGQVDAAGSRFRNIPDPLLHTPPLAQVAERKRSRTAELKAQAKINFVQARVSVQDYDTSENSRCS
jgi:hypothetical protein